jgi:hypothetical protein
LFTRPPWILTPRCPLADGVRRHGSLDFDASACLVGLRSPDPWVLNQGFSREAAIRGTLGYRYLVVLRKHFLAFSAVLELGRTRRALAHDCPRKRGRSLAVGPRNFGLDLEILDERELRPAWSGNEAGAMLCASRPADPNLADAAPTPPALLPESRARATAPSQGIYRIS